MKNTNIRLTNYWLLLSVASLALAGLFSILLVSARSPIIQNILPWHNAFKTALTIHVNLSVIVWFLAVAALMWSIMIDKKYHILHNIFTILAALSIFLIILSPFMLGGEALLNNYVPILDNWLFILAIITFLAIICFLALLFLYAPNSSYKKHFLYKISYYSAIIYIISCIALLLSFWRLDNLAIKFDLAEFYELLFWGAGHLQQVFYTQIMLIAWLILLSDLLGGFTNKKLLNCFFIIFLFNLIIALISFFIGYIYNIDSYEHIIFFTKMMRYFGGVSPFIFAAISYYLIIKNYHKFKIWHYKWLLNWSVFMFAVGGFIGYIISGSNTVIPAHYHGSIVAVTIALMGFIYHIMSKLSYPLIDKKWLNRQVFLYGGGQFMHISGFALSGGYGALRKTPAIMESLSGQIYMGLMGMGGFLSILGGLLFVLICIRMFVSRK